MYRSLMDNAHLTGLEFTGYYPGVVGKITELHAVYYYTHWGLNVSFETQVGKELSEFVRGFRPDRDGLWVAKIHGQMAGSVAIDGQSAEATGARLRWLIVEPAYQGKKIGRRLLRIAIQFCREKGYGKIYLWTFRGLDTARHLYELEGFRLCEEKEVNQWGQDIVEQRFELKLLN